MKPRTRITFILFALVFTTATIVYFSLPQPPLPPQPLYQGKTLDEWLDVSMRNPTDTDAAMKQFGPAAVPFIFRKLEENDSPLRDEYRDLWPKLPSFLRNHLPQPRAIAFNFFQAGIALGSCGLDAKPLIIARLQDRNPAVREAAWFSSPFFAGHYLLSTNKIIALCIPALRDKSPLVRTCAVSVLGQLGPAASNTVPLIVPLFSANENLPQPAVGRTSLHAMAAVSLGRIGPSAAAAIPALTNLLATGDSYARVCAAVGLWHITSNAAPSLVVITNELPTCDPNWAGIPLDALKEMGPQAKGAFPLLAELINNTGNHNGAFFNTHPSKDQMISVEEIHLLQLSNALVAIDPQAAAKFFTSNTPANLK